MKALVDDFKKDKALLRAFSNYCENFRENMFTPLLMYTTRCPVENDEKLSPTPVLNNTQKFTVYIKNLVAFPYFGMEYRKNNILGKYF